MQHANHVAGITKSDSRIFICERSLWWPLPGPPAAPPPPHLLAPLLGHPGVAASCRCFFFVAVCCCRGVSGCGVSNGSSLSLPHPPLLSCVLTCALYRQAWDLAVDICLSQLPTIIEEGTAFRVSVWKEKPCSLAQTVQPSSSWTSCSSWSRWERAASPSAPPEPLLWPWAPDEQTGASSERKAGDGSLGAFTWALSCPPPVQRWMSSSWLPAGQSSILRPVFLPSFHIHFAGSVIGPLRATKAASRLCFTACFSLLPGSCCYSGLKEY